MVRPPPCHVEDDENKVKKGPWTEEEDAKLVKYIRSKGRDTKWKSIPRQAGLNRCGKSCRLRWKNYLRPDIKRGDFSDEEERLIVHLHSSLGNKWAVIATHLPQRTDNEIKNYYNTHIKKKLRNDHQRRIADQILNFSQLINGVAPQNSSSLMNNNNIILDSFLAATLQQAAVAQSLLQQLLHNPTTFSSPILQGQHPVGGMLSLQDQLLLSARVLNPVANSGGADQNQELFCNSSQVYGVGPSLLTSNKNDLAGPKSVAYKNSTGSTGKASMLPGLVSTGASPEASSSSLVQTTEQESGHGYGYANFSDMESELEGWERLLMMDDDFTSGVNDILSSWNDG